MGVTPVAGAVGTSVTLTPVRVELPVFSTVKVYVTVWPAASTVVGDAVLAMESEGEWVTSTVTGLEPAVTVPPEGGVPAAVAVSAIEPWSTSAWVTV